MSWCRGPGVLVVSPGSHSTSVLFLPLCLPAPRSMVPPRQNLSSQIHVKLPDLSLIPNVSLSPARLVKGFLVPSGQLPANPGPCHPPQGLLLPAPSSSQYEDFRICIESAAVAPPDATSLIQVSRAFCNPPCSLARL